MIFHSRSHTTPETGLRLRIDPVMTGTHRGKINKSALHRILRGKDMVIKRPFVIIHKMNVRTRFIQHFCKAEHIVGVTSLWPLLAGEHTAEIISRMKMLTHTVTSDGDASMVYHCFPEIAGGLAPVPVAFQIGNTFETYHFRYLRIGVHPRQFILLFQQRLQHGLVRKLMSQFQVAFVAGDSGHIGKCFVQPSMFATQHILYLFIAQLGYQTNHPVREFHQHFLCFLITSLKSCITKAGIYFMNIIKRNPAVVQSETGRANVSVLYFLPHFTPVWDSTQITVTGGILAALQFTYHIIQTRLDLLISRSGIHIGKGR